MGPKTKFQNEFHFEIIVSHIYFTTNYVYMLVYIIIYQLLATDAQINKHEICEAMNLFNVSSSKTCFHAKELASIAVMFLMIPTQAVSVGFSLPWPIQQKKTKTLLVHICPDIMILILPDLPKYFKNPCSCLLTCLYTCLLLPVTDQCCSDCLDLITFPAQTSGFHSFPPLCMFVITFPSGEAFVFSFVIFQFFVSFCNLSMYCGCFFILLRLCEMFQMAPGCNITRKLLNYHMV